MHLLKKKTSWTGCSNNIQCTIQLEKNSLNLTSDLVIPDNKSIQYLIPEDLFTKSLKSARQKQVIGLFSSQVCSIIRLVSLNATFKPWNNQMFKKGIHFNCFKKEQNIIREYCTIRRLVTLFCLNQSSLLSIRLWSTPGNLWSFTLEQINLIWMNWSGLTCWTGRRTVGGKIN